MIRCLALALLAAGCAAFRASDPPLLASGRITSDFASYSIRRVGLLPIVGESDRPDEDASIRDALHAELVSATDYEVVPLGVSDLSEVGAIEPHRLGEFDPATLLELRRRYRLDAVAVASVTSRRVVPPQRLGVQLDLVSCETGATLWTSSVLLDAADVETRRALTLWSERYTEMTGGTDLVLLSPHRFARFAAWQLAQLL